jgi:hypothetical protein
MRLLLSFATIALLSAQSINSPSSSCVLAIASGKLTCSSPQTIAGPQGPVGPTGATGPTGPAATITITGGACSNADGSVGLFAKLPDGSCLPIVVSGAAIAPASTSPGGLLLLASGGQYVQVPPPPAPN